MKKSIKKIISMISMAAVIVSCMGSQIVFAEDTEGDATPSTELQAAITAGKYATNPSNKVGKNATIKIDDDFSDWSEDMLIAQGAAFDSSTAYKGAWENAVMDSYSLYGAWDDENLYIGFQMVNVYDYAVKDRGYDMAGGPLSLEGKIGGPMGLFLAIDTGKGNAMTGKLADGKSIWGNSVQYITRVDTVIAFHPDMTGTPGFFVAGSDGLASYEPEFCKTFKETGVEVGIVDGCLPASIWGVNDNKEDLKAAYSDDSDWIDYRTVEHETKYDTFFEVKIPLASLGIDKSYIESNGVGVMELGGKGESMVTCIPFDPTIMDNTMGNYGSEKSNSHEKDDEDIFTVPLASIGKVRDTSKIPDKPIDIKPTTDVKISDLKADKDSIKAGDTAKFTCTATNATDYEFTVNSEAVDKENVLKNVLTYTFDKAGTYDISVTAKNADGSKKDTKDIKVVVGEKGSEGDELSISTFKADPASSVIVNSDVNLEAKLSQEKEGMEYKFTAIDSDDKEEIIADYSSESTATWTPDKEGTYTLKVYAKEKDADEKDALAKPIANYEVKKEGETQTEELKLDSFKADTEEGNIDLDSEVNFTAKASGSDDITYKYEVIDSNDKSTELDSKDGKATWTADKEGKFKIKVTASAEGMEDVEDTKTYTVKKAEAGEDEDFDVTISTSSEDKVSLGSELSFTANPVGAKDDVTYRFIVNKISGKYSQTDFSSSNKFSFTPKEAGKYSVSVIAECNGDQIQSLPKIIEVSEDGQSNPGSTDQLQVSITSSVKTIEANKAVTITPEVTGESGTVKYQLLVNGEKYGSATSKDKLTWTPDKEGTYKISVKAVDDNGEATSEEISIKVKAGSGSTDNKDDEPTADSAPLKAFGVLGAVSLLAVAFSKKKNK